MYCQTRLNCEYDKGCPSLSAITYSDFETALASRRQFTRHFGMGISLLAAFVLSVVEMTGLLCSVLHARRTEIYGVGASRNTQSHCKARASSRRSTVALTWSQGLPRQRRTALRSSGCSVLGLAALNICISEFEFYVFYRFATPDPTAGQSQRKLKSAIFTHEPLCRVPARPEQKPTLSESGPAGGVPAGRAVKRRDKGACV